MQRVKFLLLLWKAERMSTFCNDYQWEKPFDRSIVVFVISRSWCPDRTMAQARKYIAESMGPNYAENVILDLEKTWEESDNKTPLINFLSMGSDPTSLIENLAKRHKFGKNE